MNFPARPPAECEPHPDLIAGLGGNPEKVLAARDYLVVYRTEAEVRALRPNMELLAQVDRFAAIVTAPGDAPSNKAEVDFVSRFFAPCERRSRRSSDRLGALHADSVLGAAAGQNGTARPAGLMPRR